MKVAVIASYAPSLTTFRWELLTALRAMGHRVIAMAPLGHADIEQQVRAAGIDFQPIDLNRTGFGIIHNLKSLIDLYSTLKRIKPDFVLAYTIKPVLFGSLAARACGVGRVFSMITGLGTLFTDEKFSDSLMNRFVRFLYALALRCNAAVFFQNPDDLRFFRSSRMLGAAGRAILINGSGVNTARFVPTPLPGLPVTFLMIARLIREKGIGEYLEAAHIIKRRHPQVRFLLLGTSEDHPSAIRSEELERWLDEVSVERLPPTQDVRTVLSMANVYVLPSYREGTPRTVLEAMAMGRPIITTDVPGCRETVQPDHNGFLVPAKDSSSLAIAMERFITSPALIPLMGGRSREIALAKYDVHEVNEVILSGMGLLKAKHSSASVAHMNLSKTC